MKVTVIIPTYGREQDLIDTISDLLVQEHDSYEIVVVDQNQSHERSIEGQLRRWNDTKKIHWFHPPEVDFASLTKARNFGLGKADSKSEIIIFVDDDVRVGRDFIQEHVRSYRDKKIGAVGGRIIVPHHTYPTEEPDIVAGITWWGRFVNNFYATKEQYTNGFVGCNFSVRRKVLETTGIFDTEFIGNAMREETDLAVRIRESGKEILFNPRAFTTHLMTETGGTRSAKSRMQWYHAYFHNHALFFAKHAPSWRHIFFLLAMWRPILACWLYYGKGNPAALANPFKGWKSGLLAAQRSLLDQHAWNKESVQSIF